MNIWSKGMFNVAVNERVELTSTILVLEDGYDKKFGSFCPTGSVKQSLYGATCMDDQTKIDQDIALEIALNHWVTMKSNVEEVCISLTPLLIYCDI